MSDISLPSQELCSSMSVTNEVVARKSCDMAWYCKCHHVSNYSRATLLCPYFTLRLYITENL